MRTDPTIGLMKNHALARFVNLALMIVSIPTKATLRRRAGAGGCSFAGQFMPLLRAGPSNG